MKRALRSFLRPIYGRLIHTPLIRRAIARAAVTVSTEMNVFADFVEGGFGEEYGLTKFDRANLVELFRGICRRIPSAASPEIHTTLAKELLSIPRHIDGDVIECGAYKGFSAASLSLLCRITGRKLLICDSFQGLPDTAAGLCDITGCDNPREYKKGMFCGTMEEVRRNVTKFGDLGVCEFVPGFFSESLPALSGSFVFAFLDVNLVNSMKDCLRWIWPRLAESGVIYSNDALHMDIARLCFDEEWWQVVLHERAPGLVGSGCGLPLSPKGSSLGYIRKSAQQGATWGGEGSWLDGLLQACQG